MTLEEIGDRLLESMENEINGRDYALVQAALRDAFREGLEAAARWVESGNEPSHLADEIRAIPIPPPG